MKVLWTFLSLCALQLCAISGMKAEWTQYSDSASLPMSKQYRDDLRARLQTIDPSSLKESDRKKVAQLLKLLDEKQDDSLEVSSYNPIIIMFMLIIAVGYYGYKRIMHHVTIPDAASIREMRDAKYQ